MVIFLTGEKQIGKSTAIRRFLEKNKSLKLGGYFTLHDTDEIIMVPASSVQTSSVNRKIPAKSLSPNHEIPAKSPGPNPEIPAQSPGLNPESQNSRDAQNPQGYIVGIKKTKGNPEVFNTKGVQLLKESHDADLIILDEIGWMESGAERFSQEIISLIKSGKNILGVLRKDLNTDLASFIKGNAKVITVSQENRDDIPSVLSKQFYISKDN